LVELVAKAMTKHMLGDKTCDCIEKNSFVHWNN
jgi:hypothetical protein